MSQLMQQGQSAQVMIGSTFCSLQQQEATIKNLTDITCQLSRWFELQVGTIQNLDAGYAWFKDQAKLHLDLVDVLSAKHEELEAKHDELEKN